MYSNRNSGNNILNGLTGEFSTICMSIGQTNALWFSARFDHTSNLQPMRCKYTFFSLLCIALKLLPAKRMLRLLNMHRAASPIARLRSFCYSLRYAQQNCTILMREQTFSLQRSPLHSFWPERNRLELSSVE